MELIAESSRSVGSSRRSGTTLSAFLARHQVAAAVILLLVQFLLRSYNMTIQGAYVDEGYHTERAAEVWHFDVNPGQIDNGKILLYYWLGLFEQDRSTSLFVSRLAIGLFSLVTGAAIYLLGRLLGNREIGLLALALYIVLPFALFHDRLAFADPFASAFACLVAWRSVAFGKHPRWRDGLWLGLTLAMATLAKLTLGLLPMLPVVASIIYFPRLAKPFTGKVVYWLRHYLPPLVIAAVVMTACWLPLLIPAYLVRGTANAYTLIDPQNIAKVGIGTTSEWGYIHDVVVGLNDFLGVGLWGIGIAILVCVVGGLFIPKLFRGTLLLLYWLASILCAALAIAAGTDIRYFVPAFPPIVLLVALGAATLWRLPKVTLPARLVVTGSLLVWVIGFALPFDVTALTEPAKLPLTNDNYKTYLSGTAAADADLTRVSAEVNDLAQDDTTIYADWITCHLMNFYTQPDVQCLEPIDLPDAVQDAAASLPDQISAMYVVIQAYGPFAQDVPGTCISHLARYTRPDSAPLDVWQLVKAPCWMNEMNLKLTRFKDKLQPVLTGSYTQPDSQIFGLPLKSP